MIKEFIKYLILTAIITSCVPVVTTSSSQNQLKVYKDKDFSDRVGIVQLFNTGQRGGGNPIIYLKKNENIIMHFDLLENDFKYLYAKIDHCNANWEKSSLNDIEYMSEYNEIPINNYQFSEGNITPYVTYSFQVPPVLISGNYAVSIYEEGTNKLLFVRRFCVVENIMRIDQSMSNSNDIGSRKSHHQIQFSLKYSGLNVLDPNSDIKVVMLQNHNWNIAISGLRPTLARMEDNYLEYNHFDLENNFPGLNEFRFFDIRLLSTRGNNISKVKTTPRGIEAYVQPDESKLNQVYSEPLIRDLNGKFFLQNIDPNELDSQSEYAWVNFELKTPRVNGNIYVAGRYNNWSMDEENKLYYNESAGSYQGSLYLKQGFYNYMYWVDSQDVPYYHFSGSHFQTRNEYEILVYFREQGKVYDRLVGYKFF